MVSYLISQKIGKVANQGDISKLVLSPPVYAVCFKRIKSGSPVNSLEFVKLVHSSYIADPKLLVRELSSLDEELNQKIKAQ